MIICLIDTGIWLMDEIDTDWWLIDDVEKNKVIDG